MNLELVVASAAMCTRFRLRGPRPLVFMALVLGSGNAAPTAHARTAAAGPFEAPVIERQTPKPPWPRRRRDGVSEARAKGQGLIDLKKWPTEPPPPAGEVDPETLARALAELCAEWMPPKRPLQYAHAILSAAREFEIDPFLLGALLYRQSRCLPNERSEFGTGLYRISLRMHAPYLRKGRYRYFRYVKGADGGLGHFERRELVMDRFAFVESNLRRAEPSSYFAAALLRVFQEQCPDLDGAFGSVPHRHFVSHFIFGDRVDDAGPEDRVFEARRRLLKYYAGQRPAPRAKLGDAPMHCPLDGAPRKITSAMGDDRDDGARVHRGVDFASTYAEPVRAVADGTVAVAGIDRPSGPPQSLTPETAAAVPRASLGPGGLIVMIRHGHGLVSAYMHLYRYLVHAGETVKGGQIIGLVGRSGTKESGHHLHFELRKDGQHVDPLPFLAPYVFVPTDTYVGQRLLFETSRVRRKRRRQLAQQRREQAQGIH